MSEVYEPMLPQELFAEAVWIECPSGAYRDAKIEELLQKCNLRPKKGKTIEDVRLAIGRGFKNTCGQAEKARKQIAEEVDNVCTIARWDFAVEKYRKVW